MKRRVVITGIGAVTPLGLSMDATWSELLKGSSGVRINPNWNNFEGLKSQLFAGVSNFTPPAHWSRKTTRSLTRAGLFALSSAEQAIQQAKLTESDVLKSGRCGIAFGSCLAGGDALLEIARSCIGRSIKGVNASLFTQAMTHSSAAVLAINFGIKGRVIPSSSACTSSSQAIGYGYESILSGAQDIMLAGGAEEESLPLALLFGAMHATSANNGDPERACKPFDTTRDGLVIGEGGCTFVLEALDHAEKRGAVPIAEVVGFATNCDGEHITSPTPETMSKVIELSLSQGEVSPNDIGYIHAHATGTKVGDLAESEAIYHHFKDEVPVSALKSYFGHTMGSCGSLEAACAIYSMNNSRIIPTRNFESLDPECRSISLAREIMNKEGIRYVMSNNFAFGGVNTSLIFGRL